ncbi:MAG TPA: histidinol-phosphate transaminase [Mariprofundaceae bacterium]|nr:histidinol-phosphate transaminase [Mariprofundaceae bacterium]
MIRSEIKALAAYHVQDSSGLIKLDAMENPYPLPDALRTALGKHLADVAINRYPDADMLALRTRIAERDGVKPEQVLIGNGSDEIIQMLLLAADAGECVMPTPTFVMYDLISRWLKRPVAPVPLNADFSLDANKFLQVCAREKASIAFLACPNNPTGNMWPEETIRQIAESFRGLLVIDEAYMPFAERNHTNLIGRNVLVLRTFSKFGWAGLRLGYLLGDAQLIAHLNKVRLPYNINSLTQAAAEFLLDHTAVFEKQAADIRTERERVTAALAAIDPKKVEVFPSQANFVLIRVREAGKVFDAVKAKGVLIKNLHSTNGLLANCLRLTIGTPDENNACLAALKEALA